MAIVFLFQYVTAYQLYDKLIWLPQAFITLKYLT